MSLGQGRTAGCALGLRQGSSVRPLGSEEACGTSTLCLAAPGGSGLPGRKQAGGSSRHQGLFPSSGDPKKPQTRVPSGGAEYKREITW